MRCRGMFNWMLIIGGIVLFQLVGSYCYADDATVLPKGRWRISVDSQIYYPIDERYNSDGKVEDIAKDFNVNLNSSVFNTSPLDLSLVEAAFGLPAGTGTFGVSEVSFEWDIKEATIQPAYGVTDKLSVGINIPYKWMKNTVSAELDNSTAILGFNSVVPGGIAPVGYLGTPFPTTDEVQYLLVSAGFKRLETWSDQGIGDIEAGGRYQYFKSENWRLAFTGGVRFPTGEVDNIDSFVDRAFGTGAYAILFRFHQDFVSQQEGSTKDLGVPSPGSYSVNTTFRYDLYLPDTQELRVCSVHEPICPTKDDVKRDLGDIVEAEISGSFGILKGLSLSPLYKFGHSFKDNNKGYSAIDEETDWTDHIYKISLSYTTLPLFLEGKFPLPMAFSISYRDRFAGTNNVLNSQFIGFTIAAYL